MSKLNRIEVDMDAVDEELMKLRRHINHLRNALAYIGTAGGMPNHDAQWCKSYALEALDQKYTPWGKPEERR